MKLEIKNIGIIDNATIVCDGLTVITGKNGSGKTTIAKSIASIFSSTNNNDDLLRDCVDYAQAKLKNAYENIVYLFGRHSLFFDEDGKLTKNEEVLSLPLCENVVFGRIRVNSVGELLMFLESAYNELIKHKDWFSKANKKVVSRRLLPYRNNASFEDMYNKCIELTKETIVYIDEYIKQNKYSYDKIKQQLLFSFNGQIVPKRTFKGDPTIRLSYKGSVAEYNHNSFELSHIDASIKDLNVFYIADACVIDDIDKPSKKAITNRKSDSIDPSFASLNSHLLKSLSINKNIIINNDAATQYSEIFDIINSVWPHALIKQRGITINSDNGLNVANEASGAKIFIIIKTLLLNGLLNSGTVLFFDEPENHLHPEWQGTFAKLVTLINKRIGVKIVCITHSQTMLLAFDVFSKKLENLKSFKVYFGDVNGEGARFTDLTNNIQLAHKKLTDPYVFMGYDLFNSNKD